MWLFRGDGHLAYAPSPSTAGQFDGSAACQSATLTSPSSTSNGVEQVVVIASTCCALEQNTSIEQPAPAGSFH
jgi:hypothetical protein